MIFLGLGKTLFNSSACVFTETSDTGSTPPEIELVLTERITRKKADGAWPERALLALASRWRGENVEIKIAENRDVISPRQREDALDRAIPFFDHLKQVELEQFSTKFNSELKVLTHHLCHAMAAVAMSPFEKCLIVVTDGAGSAFEDFAQSSQETHLPQPRSLRDLGGESPRPGVHEECTVYLMDNGKIRCGFKRWRKFIPSKSVPKKTFSDGVGIFYESIAEYIFNSGRSAGKVMGLAPFGRPEPVTSRVEFLEELDWKKSFQGVGKSAWDKSGHFSKFADLASCAQESLEADFMASLKAFRSEWPEYENVILTGGCALNCTFNAKLLKSKLFTEIYVPPFPGDECIGFGAASFLYYESGAKWTVRDHEKQHGNFGPANAVPDEKVIRNVFEDFKIFQPASIIEDVAERLAKGLVVAWFQGRSESGPRALGNRSILANPMVAGLKDRLNAEIKFREDFRPYGCSVLQECAHEYFEVEKGFNNPYMSFAVKTRENQRRRLSQVTHIDGSSRMQTVGKAQNPLFYELIKAFGEKTGLNCLLNTSLNIMGEPIVETAEDARKFLLATPVDGMAIGRFYIQKRAAR